MIEVSINKFLLGMARQKAEEMGKLNNSITAGEGNLAGFLGEFIAAQEIGAEVNNTYEYDLLVGDTANLIRIDVKTKRCTSKPRDFYECSIADYNTKQNCDIYVFTRLLWHKAKPQVWERGWLLGWLPKKDYFEQATFLKKGQVDPSNNYTVKADCYNLKISCLNDMVTLGENDGSDK
jgi:hypothetical protein